MAANPAGLMVVANLSLATWNVLADAYVGRDAHPGAPSRLLTAGARSEAICDGVVDLIRNLGAGVVCLQEAEPSLLPHIQERCTRHGWEVNWSPRGHGEPDGLVAIVCAPWMLSSTTPLTYADDRSYLAQRIELLHNDLKVVLYNTHFRWADDDGRTTGRQGAELAHWVAAEQVPTLVVGDLNAAPGSSALTQLRSVGCVDVHPGSDWRTAAFPGIGAVRVDYILVRGGTGTPIPVSSLQIEDARPLPDERLPSDHAPLAARIEILAEAAIGLGLPDEADC